MHWGGSAVLQRILVPTDGSELSRRVLPIVRGLARAQGAQVIFAQVVDPSVAVGLTTDDSTGPDLSVDIVESIEAEARANLAELAREFQAAGVAVQTALLYGTTASSLLEHALEVQPDLVIMATR